MSLPKIATPAVCSYHGWSKFLGSHAIREIGPRTYIKRRSGDRIVVSHNGYHIVNYYRDGLIMVSTRGMQGMAIRNRLKAVLPPHLTLHAPTLKSEWCIDNVETNTRYRLSTWGIYFNTDNTVRLEDGSNPVMYPIKSPRS